MGAAARQPGAAGHDRESYAFHLPLTKAKKKKISTAALFQTMMFSWLLLGNGEQGVDGNCRPLRRDGE